MREITLGQYYPTQSIIHKLDARIKLLVTIIYIVMLFFVQKFMLFGLIAILLLGVILASKVPLIKVVKSLKLILFLLIFTVIMTVLFYAPGEGESALWSWWIIEIYSDALINAGFLAVRLTLLVLGPTMLTYTTTPVELTDALESLLKPLSLIGIPVHYLAIIMQIALRLIPTFTEETDKIINAQKARCADFDTGNVFKRAKAMIPVLIPLFVSAFRRADDLADAMDSRCYRGAKGRTRMKRMKVGVSGVVSLVLTLIVLFVVLTVTYNFFPGVIDFTSFGWLV